LFCARPVPLGARAVDAEGLNVAAGTGLNRKRAAAFVAPSHQYPLGVTNERDATPAVCSNGSARRRLDCQDDYDSEYRYNSKTDRVVAGMDQRDRVIYIGTFSKVMFPAFGSVIIVIPPDLVERFAAMRQSMDLCPSHIPQAVMLEFIAKVILLGISAGCVRFTPNVAKFSLPSSRAHSAKAPPIHRPTKPVCTSALLLPNSATIGQLAARSAKNHLWLSPLSASYVGKSPRHGFVLGFGNARANQIPAAVRTA